METYNSTVGSFRIVKDTESRYFPTAKISSSKDAIEYARQFYHDDIEIYESMFIILKFNFDRKYACIFSRNDL
jgi:hypothetical protein